MSKLNPLFKWSGGKRREIKVFGDYYPDFIKNGNDFKFVEPFFGGGAVYWSLNAKENIINDIDFDLINFLKIVKNNSTKLISMTTELSNKIADISKLEKEGTHSISEAKTLRGEFYYEWRNKDRKDGLKDLTFLERAFRFIFVNQLAFNGMRRFNRKGEFNIPYGNYKNFNFNIKEEHINLLQKTELNCGSYKDMMFLNDTENTFIYLDPPYTREFKTYSAGNVFGDEQQKELSEIFKSMKNAKVMLIINKDDFTTELYKDYIKHTYDLKYATNIKNRYDNSVQHLVICNY
jgi:DNA adenine methylase